MFHDLWVAAEFRVRIILCDSPKYKNNIFVLKTPVENSFLYEP